MIEITQATILPRIVRGLAILDIPNRNVSTAKQVAGLIPLVTAETDCRGAISGCFTVFADASDTDNRKNDRSMFLCDFPDDTGGNLYKLQKFSGSWSDIENPFISGVFFGYNTWDAHQQRAGIEVDWHAVLLAHGVGEYRVVVDGALFSYSIILHEYNCNTTVDFSRLDISFNGTFGDINSKGYHVFNVQQGEYQWIEQARYKGGFGRRKETVNTEVYQYQDKFQQTNERSLKNSFNLDVFANDEIAGRLTSYGLMSSEIQVTEYNLSADKYYTNFSIQYNSGEIERSYHDYTDLLFRISVEVDRAYDNLGFRTCI